MSGKRYELSKPAARPSGGDPDDSASRTQDQVLTLIEQEGQQPPDWFDTTPLDYPQTLDLSFPLKAPNTGWNNQLNVGQYLWDIIILIQGIGSRACG